GIVIRRPFQGRSVVQLMRKNPQLLEDINIVQGDNVEIPGEIVPTGAQLIKQTPLRYAMSRMFNGFYNKGIIRDAQRALYGLPTSDQMFEEYRLAEAQATIGEESDQYIIDSTLSAGVLPDQSSTFDKLARHDRMFDISLNQLNINATKNFAFGLQLGAP